MAVPTPIPTVNDIFRVSYICQMAPQIGVNVRFYRVSGKVGVDMDYGEMATILSTLAASYYKPIIHTFSSYWGLKLMPKYTDPPPYLATIIDNTGHGVGTAAGDPLPEQTCGIFTCQSAFAGRKYRGRCYVPFPAEDDNDLLDSYARPNAGYMTRLGTLAGLHANSRVLTSVVHVGDTVTIQPILFHGNRVTATTVDILGAFARQKWATQRRRSVYGRTNEP